jgi:2-polyprenyl-3-methyl-5-hydroxy-6-metoxy-1,4-benzoquinol methylase
MAMDYLSPGFGDTLVDMSCGSGLFTREFAKSGKFPTVIAAGSRPFLVARRCIVGSTASVAALF